VTSQTSKINHGLFPLNRQGLAIPARGKRITIESILYVLGKASEPEGTTLNKLTRKRFGSYRDASGVINKLVQCGMIRECIVRDYHQIPRVAFVATEKGRSVIGLFEGWC